MTEHNGEATQEKNRGILLLHLFSTLDCVCVHTACCHCTETLTLTMPPLCLEGTAAEETRSDPISSPPHPTQSRVGTNKDGWMETECCLATVLWEGLESTDRLVVCRNASSLYELCDKNKTLQFTLLSIWHVCQHIEYLWSDQFVFTLFYFFARNYYFVAYVILSDWFFSLFLFTD